MRRRGARQKRGQESRMPNACDGCMLRLRPQIRHRPCNGLSCFTTRRQQAVDYRTAPPPARMQRFPPYSSFTHRGCAFLPFHEKKNTSTSCGTLTCCGDTAPWLFWRCFSSRPARCDAAPPASGLARTACPASPAGAREVHAAAPGASPPASSSTHGFFFTSVRCLFSSWRAGKCWGSIRVTCIKA